MRHLAAVVSSFITKLEEFCLAGGILGIAGLSIGNVLSRSLLGQSLVFAEETSQFLIVFVTFLGLGYAAGQGRHIRMTALYDQLPERARKRLMLFICFTTAALFFYLALLAVRYSVGTVRELGSLSPVLQVPLWIIYLAAPVGFVLAAIQYSLAFVKNLTTEEVYLSFEKRDEYDDATPGKM